MRKQKATATVEAEAPQQQADCGSCLCRGAGPALTELIQRLGPPEGARRHFEQARVEFLKGIRSLIDSRIEDLSRKETRGTKVSVE